MPRRSSPRRRTRVSRPRRPTPWPPSPLRARWCGLHPANSVAGTRAADSLFMRCVCCGLRVLGTPQTSFARQGALVISYVSLLCDFFA